MFMLHGPSGTGKSVLTSVLTRVFGDYGTTAPATTFRLKKNETTVDIHQLRGKRFVATSEMPEGAQLDEELVKRVTGGDIITSRALYESFHHWRPQCVVWIATNFLPRLSSDDNAIWRRAKTIPMRTEFGPHASKAEIEGLSDQLLQERDGILNWLLDGLADYRANGLGEPPAVTKDIEDYRTDMDSVAAWFREEIDMGVLELADDGRTPTQLLYQRYHSHCSEAGFTPLGRARFTKRLSNMSSAISYQKIGGQMTWFGIKTTMS
jgi:putative DNA primase/helicase